LSQDTLHSFLDICHRFRGFACIHVIFQTVGRVSRRSCRSDKRNTTEGQIALLTDSRVREFIQLCSQSTGWLSYQATLSILQSKFPDLFQVKPWLVIPGPEFQSLLGCGDLLHILADQVKTLVFGESASWVRFGNGDIIHFRIPIPRLTLNTIASLWLKAKVLHTLIEESRFDVAFTRAWLANSVVVSAQFLVFGPNRDGAPWHSDCNLRGAGGGSSCRKFQMLCFCVSMLGGGPGSGGFTFRQHPSARPSEGRVQFDVIALNNQKEHGGGSTGTTTSWRVEFMFCIVNQSDLDNKWVREVLGQSGFGPLQGEYSDHQKAQQVIYFN
jgi:hypothetical protein